jgi:hypothetical protein
MRFFWLLTLLIVAGLATAGCDAIVGIFKAGVWTGVVMVAVLLLGLGFLLTKLRA